MTPTEIHECLEKLGKTADEVHISLLVMGIRGRRGGMLGCPLANYIKTISNEKMVLVCRTSYGVNEIDYPLPKPCNDFVLNYDCGFYPDLEVV